MSLTEFPKIIQGTPEWHDQRRGLVTASVVGKLITVGTPDALTVQCPRCHVIAGHPCRSVVRKEPTPIKTIHDARASLAANQPPGFTVADNDTSFGLTATLVAERITGWTEETAVTADMWRGIDSEPIARDIYSGHYQQATETGFMRFDGDGWTLGYSPDGLVGFDGLLEIKAPRAKTHLNTILADEVPGHYMPQLQAGLLVSGRKWIDFCSYVGGMPLFVKRVYPDPDWQAAIIAAATAFELAAIEMVAAYRNATDGLPATERIDHNLVELKL